MQKFGSGTLRIAVCLTLGGAGLSACSEADGDGADEVGEDESEDTSSTDSSGGETQTETSDGPSSGTESTEGTDSAETSTGGPVEAVLGLRCAPGDLIGEVSLSNEGQAPLLGVWFNDRPSPQYGPPVLSAGGCDHYAPSDQWPCDCEASELCSWAGSCKPRPMPTDFNLVVTANGVDQVFNQDSLGGGLPVGEGSYSFELKVLGQIVTLEPVDFPEPLSGLGGVLTGTFDAPIAIDLSWDPTESDSQVHSLTRINHHVQSPTSTQCQADTSEGAMHIGEPMLAPLAVGTGLEFQAVEHAVVAAAEIDEGCIEFALTVYDNVSLD